MKQLKSTIFDHILTFEHKSFNLHDAVEGWHEAPWQQMELCRGRASLQVLEELPGQLMFSLDTVFTWNTNSHLNLGLLQMFACHLRENKWHYLLLMMKFELLTWTLEFWKNYIHHYDLDIFLVLEDFWWDEWWHYWVCLWMLYNEMVNFSGSV